MSTISPYIGDVNQLMTVQTSRLTGGRQEGVLLTRVDNGAGLSVTVLPDRCMDLYQIRFLGHNLNYLSPAGIVAPAYYDAQGGNWLRSFFAGFLTTCGLTNIGGGSTLDGEEYPMHGRIANAPAEDYLARTTDDGDGLRAVLTGRMREAAMFGENLSLERRIEIPYGENLLCLTDTITNRGFRRQPYALLYHFNMGYPFLSEKARLQMNSKKVWPRCEAYAPAIPHWADITPPTPDTEEIVLFHELEKDENGRAEYTVVNPALGIGLTVNFDAVVLGHFTQWKMFNQGEYTMGLEPCNTLMGDRKLARETGQEHYLMPGEAVTHTIRLRFFAVGSDNG